MTKIYVAQKRSPSLSPLIDDLPINEKTWVEKFALKSFKMTLIFLILTMGFLILAQQLLNRELAAENDRLRNLVGDKLDNFHPYFDQYISEFENFKRRFNKIYESKSEEQQRRRIFFNKMQEIEKFNDESESTEFDINEFADMTEEEFKQMLLPLNYFKKLRKESTFIKKIDLAPLETAVRIPPRFDWREKNVVTPVKSQHHCGSCWAFATVATVESNWAIAHGELRNLSEQELLDCNLENNACSGGDVDKAFRFVHERGLMTGEDYPYVAHRQNSCSLVTKTKIAKIDVAYWLNPTEDAILDWLVNYGPVNIGISVPPSMQAYKGGIYTPTPYECKFKVLGLHALMIVGYGTTDEGEKYWIVKNSWGGKWGEAGYVRFARGINGCGIEDEPLGILA